jgi:hypothetical protein
MPNKRNRDKKGRASSRRRTVPTSRTGDSVKALLQRSSPAFESIAKQAEKQRNWRSWLAVQLAGELFERITGIVEHADELVIFVESASWGVRLRYALAELDGELRASHPRIVQIAVRVMPRS